MANTGSKKASENISATDMHLEAARSNDPASEKPEAALTVIAAMKYYAHKAVSRATFSSGVFERWSLCKCTPH